MSQRSQQMLPKRPLRVLLCNYSSLVKKKPSAVSSANLSTHAVLSKRLKSQSTPTSPLSASLFTHHDKGSLHICFVAGALPHEPTAAFIQTRRLRAQREQWHCHVARGNHIEREITSTPSVDTFTGWWMDRCQGEPTRRLQPGVRQINLRETLTGRRVAVMTAGLEPKAGARGPAHPRGVMCLWLTVNPPLFAAQTFYLSEKHSSLPRPL